jgi:preprotein translocase subunit SecD
LVLGFTYALPNLYPTQPSIQVAYTDSGKSADQSLLNELEDILETNQVSYEELFLRDGKIVIKFSTLDQQLESKTILQNKLLDKVIIALNLEPTTPDWLKNLGGKPVKLGLDLSGGVHFLLEVDIDTAQQGRLELLLDTYRKTFKEDRLNPQLKISNYILNLKIGIVITRLSINIDWIVLGSMACNMLLPKDQGLIFSY